jgi:4-hydroxybenzoate polyprenyltransferase
MASRFKEAQAMRSGNLAVSTPSSRSRTAGALHQIADFGYLIRIFSCANGALLVYFLAIHQKSPRGWCLIAAATAFCSIGCAFSFNDAMDVIEDKENSPSRPVAAGRISQRAAFCTYGVLASSAVVLGFALRSMAALYISIAMISLVSVYSTLIKPMWPVKTVYIAAVVCLLPALAWTGSPHLFRSKHLILFVVLFLWALMKEILADIRDLMGDTHSGLMTLPRKLGKKWSARLIFAMNVCLWCCVIISIRDRTASGLFVFASIAALHTAWLTVCMNSASPERLRFYLRFQVCLSAIGLIYVVIH